MSTNDGRITHDLELIDAAAEHPLEVRFATA
jgi:hypothetical protein